MEKDGEGKGSGSSDKPFDPLDNDVKASQDQDVAEMPDAQGGKGSGAKGDSQDSAAGSAGGASGSRSDPASKKMDQNDICRAPAAEPAALS